MIHHFINILILALVIIFIIILKQQAFHSKIENFKNTNTKQKYNTEDDSDEFILAQQNAGNIQVLKDRVKHLEVLKNKVIENSNKIKVLENSLKEIVEEQMDISSQKNKQ